MAPPPAEERPEDARPPSADLMARLEELTGAVASLEDRIDRLEARLRSDVSDEVHAAAAELRRTVSELGRRLALDLPQVLARHRDTILAELRPSRAARPRATPAGSGGDAVTPGSSADRPEPAAAQGSPLELVGGEHGPEPAQVDRLEDAEAGGPQADQPEVWVAPGSAPGEEPSGVPADPTVPAPGVSHEPRAVEPVPADDAAQRRRGPLLRRRSPR